MYHMSYLILAADNASVPVHHQVIQKVLSVGKVPLDNFLLFVEEPESLE